MVKTREKWDLHPFGDDRMNTFSKEIAGFILETDFEDLPDAVIRESKRIIMDSLACALAGVESDRGKYAVALSERLGGPREASIIGTSFKGSCAYTAFANGELVNALDYDALEIPPGHTPPYVIPAALSMAEHTEATGKDLILAVALGHEVAARIDRALVPRKGAVKEETEWQQSRQREESYLASGQSHLLFGGTAAGSRLLNLDETKIIHALGISGHFCPIPTNRKFQAFMPSAMTKYGTSGWASIASVTAVLLAELGYLGDTSLFEGEYAFWRMYSYGGWEPDKALEKIGKTWFSVGMGYKPYPCHRAMHGPLDCLMSILHGNAIMPEEIERIRVLGNPAIFESRYPMEVPNHVAAQFNPLYIFSCAANRIDAVYWQSQDTMKSPEVLRFMERIVLGGLPDMAERMGRDPRSRWGGTAEVFARSKKYMETRMFAKGTSGTEAEMTDDELIDKFRRSGFRVLPGEKMDRAVSYLCELEDVKDIKGLMSEVTL
ncbi:MAG: MmgE/PrpD family protein [Deltaproteobacteria bacterium]|nr:MmgE/PrpD family protein [Deltaproteobacteria bacterium]MBW2063806.1 MmgE/PrpD family protein [Deltaproteobacteria bacterium]